MAQNYGNTPAPAKRNNTTLIIVIVVLVVLCCCCVVGGGAWYAWNNGDAWLEGVPGYSALLPLVL